MKIQTYQGKYDDTCTVSSNLTQNQLKKPVIRDVIMYSEPRMLTTLIVSGAKSPYDLEPGTDNLKTKIGKIPEGKLIGDNAYRYNIQGRIQEKSTIIQQIGSTSSSGEFRLQMRDNKIYPGMMTKFYSDTFYARCQQVTAGASGSFIMVFQSATPGVIFDWNIHVAPQNGEKTAFGAYTTYSARSLRGHSRSFYPSQFINHLTIQRKTIAIDGSALTDVTWVNVMGSDTKGWFYTKERQARLQSMMEDEHAKVFGTSTMRDADGKLLSVSPIVDPDTGNEVIAGDGMLPQIDGQNSFFSSGPEGKASIDDFKDMMATLEKRSRAIYGKKWIVITGTDGYLNAQEVLRDYWIASMGGRSQAGAGSSKVGGEDISVGGNFDTLNMGGNQLVFVKHPMFDDPEKWFERNSYGHLCQSNMYMFIDNATTPEGPNMEILGKGAYGINRTNVSGYINGITGDSRDMQTSVDAIEWNFLKEDGIFIYNTQSCGVLRMPSN